MSTRNDKCPGCGAGEVVKGTPLYACGTTLETWGLNRSATCHGIETAMLRRRIAHLEASARALVDALEHESFDATEKRHALEEALEAKS